MSSTSTGAPENRSATGKGKARESRDDGSRFDNSPTAEQSMTSRIVSSASGLVKDAVGSSNGHIPSTMASSSSLGGKSQSNSAQSGPSAWADTVSARPGPSMNGRGGSQSVFAPQESFRTQPIESSVTSDYETFMIANPELETDLEIRQNHPSSWTADFKGYSPSHKRLQGMDIPDGLSSQHSQTGFDALEQYDDGAEVRLLLSDPAFNALTDTNDMKNMQEPSDATVNDLFPQLFTAEEQSVVNKIQLTLPAPPTHKPVPANHPLNLRPRSDEEKELLHQEIREFRPTLSDETTAQTMFSDEAQREEWVSEWDGVLNGYTDEVWGDLLPVVQAAKSQLEEVRSGNSILDHKAIARLKMILGHVNGQPATMDATFSRIRSVSVEGREGQEGGPRQFHCPWVSCNQRFQSEQGLQLHTRSHQQ